MQLINYELIKHIPHVYAIVEENNKVFVFGGGLEDKLYNDVIPSDIDHDEMLKSLSYIRVIRHTNRDPENKLYLVKVDKNSGKISKKTIEAIPRLTFKRGLNNLLTFGALDDPSRKMIKLSREGFFQQLRKYESNEVD